MSASSTELTVRNEEDLVPAGPNPMTLLELALKKNVDADKLEKLMGLAERWQANEERREKNEARKAFVEAMSAFKSHAITVQKDKENAQYGSRYVSLGNLVTSVTPYLSQHDLSVRWDIDQTCDPKSIKVTCIVTHKLGHAEAVSMSCPPDNSGQKNPIQQVKSAITYAKACTFESLCGLASTDANLDDDGNGTSEQWVEDYLAAIESANDANEIDRLFREAYRKASEAKNQRAQKLFVQTKDARKKALRCQ